MWFELNLEQIDSYLVGEVLDPVTHHLLQMTLHQVRLMMNSKLNVVVGFG